VKNKQEDLINRVNHRVPTTRTNRVQCAFVFARIDEDVTIYSICYNPYK